MTRSAVRCLSALVLAAVGTAGCWPLGGGLTQRRYHEATAGYADGSPWSVAEIVRRFPELDGILITAPDHMEEMEREQAKREREGRRPIEDYRVAVGATIQIEVYGEGDLTRSYTIGPTGRIDFPHIGEVEIRDRTLTEIKAEIRERLREFIRNPQVLINLTTIQSIGVTSVTAGSITIITQGKSSTFNFTGDERVSQALASVDAVTDRDEWRQVRIIRRPTATRKARVILVDMWRLITSADLRQDVPLAPGDIIYVPRFWSFGDQLEKDADFMLKYFGRVMQTDDFVKYLETKF